VEEKKVLEAEKWVGEMLSLRVGMRFRSRVCGML
jgi:hypothetical protein